MDRLLHRQADVDTRVLAFWLLVAANVVAWSFLALIDVGGYTIQIPHVIAFGPIRGAGPAERVRERGMQDEDRYPVVR